MSYKEWNASVVGIVPFWLARARRIERWALPHGTQDTFATMILIHILSQRVRHSCESTAYVLRPDFLPAHSCRDAQSHSSIFDNDDDVT
jgi:hypothetical protein